MDRLVKPQIAILNLAGDISPELRNYFDQKLIFVVDPDVDQTQYEWTHILCSDLHDFVDLMGSYDTIEKDIRIISLTAVEDVQHFVNCNGKLIIDNMWMQSHLGELILDKFFQEYGGIALGDSYPTFVEKGSFIITNPFNTGEYLDRLVQSAYLDGVSGLSIKTYFDHLLMYLTGLKTKGKLAFPIEVTYGYFKDIFALQFNFFTKDLVLQDVTSSLSSGMSKEATRYLLKVAIQSSDFFDFTLLKSVNKSVVTALWTKEESLNIENKGILFNEIEASAPITVYPSEGITSFQMNDSVIEDFSDKVVFINLNKLEENIDVVSGPSTFEAKEAKVIHGSETEADIISIVKGKVEEEEEHFRVSGSQDFDVDKFAYRISAGIDDKSKGDDTLKIKSLKLELPEAIKASFNDFTKRLSKTVETISEQDLEDFKDNEIPKIIQQAAKKVDKEYILKTQGAIKSLENENDDLKSKLNMLMSEIRLLKESKAKMAEINQMAKNMAETALIASPDKKVDEQENQFKVDMIQKMQGQQPLNDYDSKRLASLLEKENKFIYESREHEKLLKKLQIEVVQKEAFFVSELEKVSRLMKSKDLVLHKAKEGMAKLVERKDHEIKVINEKLNQVNKSLASKQGQTNTIHMRELEKKVTNYEKMIEIYKNQMNQKPTPKVADDGNKEQIRKAQMLSNNLKHQIEVMKKDLSKYQEKATQDSVVINTLKAEKLRVEQLLKKSVLEIKSDNFSVENEQLAMDFRRLQSQHEMVESQLRESQNRFRDLEAKLQESLKNQKKDAATDENNGRGKTAHLENSVRKLTQDLGESKNQLAEMKKESNKLRQEKIALQNMMDKMKKDSDKSKAAAPKKPTPGGKAA